MQDPLLCLLLACLFFSFFLSLILSFFLSFFLLVVWLIVLCRVVLLFVLFCCVWFAFVCLSDVVSVPVACTLTTFGVLVKGAVHQPCQLFSYVALPLSQVWHSASASPTASTVAWPGQKSKRPRDLKN